MKEGSGGSETKLLLGDRHLAIKSAIVGAGSLSFGPCTIQDILLSNALCDAGVELVLMDTVAEHLPEREKVARHVAEKLDRTASVSCTCDLDQALAGADYVVAAIEVNRWLYWSQDFHVPRQYGFMQIYGENGGPGGLFHALRNMGPMLRCTSPGRWRPCAPRPCC